MVIKKLGIWHSTMGIDHDTINNNNNTIICIQLFGVYSCIISLMFGDYLGKLPNLICQCNFKANSCTCSYSFYINQIQFANVYLLYSSIAKLFFSHFSAYAVCMLMCKDIMKIRYINIFTKMLNLWYLMSQHKELQIAYNV